MPAEVLRRESLNAGLLVIGNRGLGTFLGKLVGSVSLDLAAACPCPLVVIRARHEEQKPVVACVDGHLRSSKVLEQAVPVARSLQTALRIVHVDTRPPGPGRHTPSRFHGRTVLHNAMLRVRELDPDLAVTEDLLSGEPVARALIGAGADAELLVLGAQAPKATPARWSPS